jgi:hypothetical protein
MDCGPLYDALNLFLYHTEVAVTSMATARGGEALTRAASDELQQCQRQFHDASVAARAALETLDACAARLLRASRAAHGNPGA